MPSPITVERQRGRWDMPIVLAVACLLRLYVVWSVLTQQPRGWLFGRGLEMGWLAEALLKGQGLSNPFGPPTGPTAFIAPGYPLLVAAVFKLFGVYTQTSEAVLLLLHTAANVLTVALIMVLAKRLAGRTAALLAGLFWACSIPLLWMPSIFWETSISIALLMLLFVLTLNASQSPSKKAWIGLGAFSAVLALINPALLLTIVAVLAWLAIVTWKPFPSHRSGLALSLLTFAIVFSPWPIRNARVFHAFIPLRTTVGFELWMGNLPSSHGYLNETVFPSYNQQELDDYKRMGEIAYTNNKSRLAKQEILANPAAFASMTARRFVRFWSGNGNSQGSPLYVLHATLTTLLGLAGLSLLLRKRRYALVALFAIPLILFPAPYYITHAEFRYRLEIDPLLTVLSGVALAAIFTSRKEPDASA
ncbi:ArnT family glycosyltransferase [Bryocella elongata]|nr:glycosyltransferase family 39 protein [Bryocella elongata]